MHRRPRARWRGNAQRDPRRRRRILDRAHLADPGRGRRALAEEQRRVFQRDRACLQSRDELGLAWGAAKRPQRAVQRAVDAVEAQHRRDREGVLRPQIEGRRDLRCDGCLDGQGSPASVAAILELGKHQTVEGGPVAGRLTLRLGRLWQPERAALQGQIRVLPGRRDIDRDRLRVGRRPVEFGGETLGGVIPAQRSLRRLRDVGSGAERQLRLLGIRAPRDAALAQAQPRRFADLPAVRRVGRDRSANTFSVEREFAGIGQCVALTPVDSHEAPSRLKRAIARVERHSLALQPIQTTGELVDESAKFRLPVAFGDQPQSHARPARRRFRFRFKPHTQIDVVPRHEPEHGVEFNA